MSEHHLNEKLEALGKGLLELGWSLAEAEGGVEQMRAALERGLTWAQAKLTLHRKPEGVPSAGHFFAWPYFTPTLLREYREDIIEELQDPHGFSPAQAACGFLEMQAWVDEEGRAPCDGLLARLLVEREAGKLDPPMRPDTEQWRRVLPGQIESEVRFEERCPPEPAGHPIPPECQEMQEWANPFNLRAGWVDPYQFHGLRARLPAESSRGGFHDAADNRLVVRMGLEENNRVQVSLSGQGGGRSEEVIRFGGDCGRYMRGGWQAEAIPPCAGSGEPRVGMKRLGAMGMDVLSLDLAEEMFLLMGLAIMDARRLMRGL